MSESQNLKQESFKKIAIIVLQIFNLLSFNLFYLFILKVRGLDELLLLFLKGLRFFATDFRFVLQYSYITDLLFMIVINADNL